MSLLSASALGLAHVPDPVPPKAGSPSPRRIEFNRDIRPILSENCFACHGPDRGKRQANLRLDQRDAAVQQHAVVPGRPDQSKLIARIQSINGALLMPPPSSHKKLTTEQKSLLVRWVKEGAEYQAHWSYIIPKRPPVPATLGSFGKSAAVGNSIDAFILAKLAERRLQPSPEADRRTLIRRVSLDLIGLPPTTAEVDAFLRDTSPNAYEKVVDRLLASPRYGERMAVPWLDIVRYADTVGYHGDQNMNAWAYRDYVIKSLNENKPFDRFTIEQIAGDLLPNATTETRVATCFNRLNMVTREGGAQPKEYLAKYAADRVRTVGMAWLGSTMGCAECHDHKFDPISTKDFYAMAAFFADVKQWGYYADASYAPNPDLRGFSNDHPFPPEIKVESAWLKQRIAQNSERRRRLAAEALSMGSNPAFATWTQKTRAFLAVHTGGWETPADVDVAGADGKKPSGEPWAVRQADGSLQLAAAAPADITLQCAPSAAPAAVRIELLPKGPGESILREGAGGTLRIAIGLRKADGTLRLLTVRYASANFYSPRYANGFEILGVQGAWQLDPRHLKEAHKSLWLLEGAPVLESGDRLQVTIKGARLAGVRLSLSPLQPSDPGALDFPPDDLRLATADETVAYVRATGQPASAYAKIKAIDRDTLECHGGTTPVMVTESVPPMTVRVLPRGNWQDESGEVVQPAVPHFLPQSTLPKGRPLNRLDLANWLVSPENPLTSRMFVNRMWKQFFGAGLSEKLDDLGAQGDAPSHAELLDWLAVEFRERGWDMKRLVRLIVTSSTYRQSSRLRPDALKVDPSNRLLASQNPRRLEAEFVRDNALSIAGLLNVEVGGPPCKPYQPAGYYANLQFPDRDYLADTDDQQWRRGVYMHWQRIFLHPMLAAFDAPSREDCVAIRSAANTPQQALTLLNDPEFVEAARHLGSELMAAPGSDADRLDRAFRRALSRPVKSRERDSLLAFLSRMRESAQAGADDAKKILSVGASPPSVGDETELAAWTQVCRVILNLHETITRY